MASTVEQVASWVCVTGAEILCAAAPTSAQRKWYHLPSLTGYYVYDQQNDNNNSYYSICGKSRRAPSAVILSLGKKSDHEDVSCPGKSTGTAFKWPCSGLHRCT